MNERTAEKSAASEFLTRHIPRAQFARYLLVGGWNTLFGYSVFFLITRWLSRVMPAYSYIVAIIASNLINVTVAFLGYKWFVFRTRNNYLREWGRSLIVYSGSIVFSAAAIGPLVGLIRHFTRYERQAPYIAGALLAVMTVVSSFFGHKHLSFREALTAPPAEEGGSSHLESRGYEIES